MKKIKANKKVFVKNGLQHFERAVYVDDISEYFLYNGEIRRLYVDDRGILRSCFFTSVKYIEDTTEDPEMTEAKSIIDFEHQEQSCAVTESVKWVAVTVNSDGKTEIFHKWIDEGESWAVPAFREHAERMGGTVLALFRADDVVNVCSL